MIKVKGLIIKVHCCYLVAFRESSAVAGGGGTREISEGGGRGRKERQELMEE